jgi:predicted ATP-dependent endonuclease of OLD family
MKVAGFRSVTYDLILRIRPSLTCLIGANEHGKSNLLDAINFLDGFTFEPTDTNTWVNAANHPRLVYRLELSKGERADIVKALDQDLAGPISEDSEAVKTRNFQQRSRDYFAAGGSEITQTVYSNSTRVITVPNVVQYSGFAPRSSANTHLIPAWTQKHLPAVRLFEGSDDLVDSITLDELNSRKNLPFEGLLKIAGAWNDRALLFEESVAGRQRLDQAARALTRRIRKIWSQAGNHTYLFDQSGGILHLSIKDPTTFDVPSRRSLGLRSFFSFYLALYAETNETDPKGFILLFDEPGIHLHPQGQKDLLREIRKLAVKNQIVYTTHSPFMIDRNEPENTILVFKSATGKKRGTRINYKPWGANWNPLSGALGVTASDAFFLPDRPLLVEGTSDKLYLATYMRLSQAETGADLNYLNMIDADRREDVEATLRILLGADRAVVVLVDGDPGGGDWIKHLKRLAGSKKGLVQVLNIGEILNSSKPVSIEDALPQAEFFVAAQQYVNTVIQSDHVIDTLRVMELAESHTLGRALADYLANASVIKRAKDLSKTSIAHLFCQSALSKPAKDDRITRVCVEITRALQISD